MALSNADLFDLLFPQQAGSNPFRSGGSPATSNYPAWSDNAGAGGFQPMDYAGQATDYSGMGGNNVAQDYSGYANDYAGYGNNYAGDIGGYNYNPSARSGVGTLSDAGTRVSDFLSRIRGKGSQAPAYQEPGQARSIFDSLDPGTRAAAQKNLQDMLAGQNTAYNAATDEALARAASDIRSQTGAAFAPDTRI